jgi:hypothetical protein
MALLSGPVMEQRLASVLPIPGSPNFVSQSKIYKEVEGQYNAIIENRKKDAAGQADQFPDVAALKTKVEQNPSDIDAAHDLAVARVKTEQLIGIPLAYQTPISQEEAGTIAKILNDPAVAPVDKAKNIQNVVDRVRALTGNDPVLAHQAMTTVLTQTGVDKGQAELTATALVQAGQPPEVATLKDPPKKVGIFGSLAQYLSTKDNYLAGPGSIIDPMTGMPLPGTAGAPGEQPKEPPPAIFGTGEFTPGQKLIPGGHIQQLLEGKVTPGDFDNDYGRGAADYFKGGGSPTATVPEHPPASDATTSADFSTDPTVFDPNKTPEEDYPENAL